MPATDLSRRLMDLLVTFESATGELYQLYARRIPEHKAFWEKMAREEALHADVLRRLAATMERGKISFNREAFKIPAVQSALNFLRQRIEQAEVQPPGMVQALSIAVSVEQSIIEKKFYQVLQPDEPKVKKILETLHAEALQHRADLERRWNEAKATPSKPTTREIHPTS